MVRFPWTMMLGSIVGLAFFLPALIHPAFAQSMSCSECYSIQRPRCDASCAGSGTREAFTACATSCVQSACASPCDSRGGRREPSGSRDIDPAEGNTSSRFGTFSSGGFQEFGGASDESDTSSCGNCIRRMASGECAQSCTGEMGFEDPGSCRQRCAKARCAHQCSLPGRVLEDPKPATAKDCAHCKRTQTIGCRNNCGNNPDRPGYTTCLVSCVEDRCLETCNPESG